MSEKKVLGKIEPEFIGDPAKFQKVFEIKLFAADFKDDEIKRKHATKIEEYCTQALDFMKKLKEKSVPINKIYFEALDIGTESAIKVVKKMLQRIRPYERILDYLLEHGAVLQKTEDEVLLNESLAWLEGINSLQGFEIDVELYLESLRERDEYISSWIQIDLKENENAVIFLSYERKISLKKPFKLIKIRPPVVDDLEKMVKKIY
ncbi:MAG: hypothetical protein ACTSVY_06525 [Candidatus Helarchaeota archaeon]